MRDKEKKKIPFTALQIIKKHIMGYISIVQATQCILETFIESTSLGIRCCYKHLHLQRRK